MQEVVRKTSNPDNPATGVCKVKSKRKKYLLESLDQAKWVLGANKAHPGLLDLSEKDTLVRIVRAGQLWTRYIL